MKDFYWTENIHSVIIIGIDLLRYVVKSLLLLFILVAAGCYSTYATLTIKIGSYTIHTLTIFYFQYDVFRTTHEY